MSCSPVRMRWCCLKPAVAYSSGESGLGVQGLFWAQRLRVEHSPYDAYLLSVLHTLSYSLFTYKLQAYSAQGLGKAQSYMHTCMLQLPCSSTRNDVWYVLSGMLEPGLPAGW